MQIIRKKLIAAFNHSPQDGDVMFSRQLFEPRIFDKQTGTWEIADDMYSEFNWVTGERIGLADMHLLKDPTHTRPSSGIVCQMNLIGRRYDVLLAVAEAHQLYKNAGDEPNLNDLVLTVSDAADGDETEIFTIRKPVVGAQLKLGSFMRLDGAWRIPFLITDDCYPRDNPAEQNYVVRIFGEKSRDPGKIINFCYSRRGDAEAIKKLLES